MRKRVAVIDIGSNSIKALVAESDGTNYGVSSLWEGSREVRISTGIAGENPMLRQEDIKAALQAVEELYQCCHDMKPIAETRILATSAVRNAANGHDFLESVRGRTTVRPLLLSGQEEADYIAVGVRSDPALGGRLAQFSVFDLGGGSLELIHFDDNHVAAGTSLPLGSVRLTEMFVQEPRKAVPEKEIRQLSNHVRAMIGSSGIPLKAPLIGCSGGLTMWRAIRAQAAGIPMQASSARFTQSDVDEMIAAVVHRDLEHRILHAHIPPQRADIFPVALITFQVLLELYNTTEIQHSLHNLRYGVAWELLQD